MRRLLLPRLLVLGLAMGPGEALAQAGRPSPDEARRLVLDYATCIVERSHDKAAQALLANADDDTIKRDFRRLIDGRCLRFDVDSIGFDADFYRYALADALVAAEFADHGPSDFSDRPPLAHLPSPTPADLDAALAEARSAKARDDATREFQEAQVVAGLSRYGECVVREDPNSARLWLLTRPGSREEASRIDALRPSFGACLKDGTVDFSKATLRGTVALNYYRLAHATAPPIAGEAQ